MHVLVPEMRLAGHEEVAGLLVLALVIERNLRHLCRWLPLPSRATFPHAVLQRGRGTARVLRPGPDAQGHLFLPQR